VVGAAYSHADMLKFAVLAMDHFMAAANWEQEHHWIGHSPQDSPLDGSPLRYFTGPKEQL